jgi:hypothetical protein
VAWYVIVRRCQSLGIFQIGDVVWEFLYRPSAAPGENPLLPCCSILHGWLLRRGNRQPPERCALCEQFGRIDCIVSMSSSRNAVSHFVCKELFVTLCKLFGGLDCTVSMSSCNTVLHCVSRESAMLVAFCLMTNCK